VAVLEINKKTSPERVRFFISPATALNGRQCLFQIGNQIINMFDPDG
jgi:hypothetical protein